MHHKTSLFSNTLTLGITVLACITAIRVQAQERQLLDGVQGQRYDSEVPSTLDLAERAKAALGVMTSGRRYSWGQLTIKGSKWSEAIPLLRLMSGSELNLERDREGLQHMLDTMPNAKEHGLAFGQEPASPELLLLNYAGSTHQQSVCHRY